MFYTLDETMEILDNLRNKVIRMHAVIDGLEDRAEELESHKDRLLRLQARADELVAELDSFESEDFHEVWESLDEPSPDEFEALRLMKEEELDHIRTQLGE